MEKRRRKSDRIVCKKAKLESILDLPMLELQENIVRPVRTNGWVDPDHYYTTCGGSVMLVVGKEKREITSLSFVLTLYSYSPVFEIMTSDLWQANYKEQVAAAKEIDSSVRYIIELKGDDPQAWKALVQFLHREDTTFFDGETFSTWLHILDILKKYLFRESLLLWLIEKLSAKLSIETALSLYFAGRVYDDSGELEKKAYDILRKNGPLIIQTEDFATLHYLELKEIIKDQILMRDVKESNLLLALCRWAERHCEEYKIEITNVNLRCMLKDVLSLINYNKITAEEFLNICEFKGIFKVDEMFKILKHYREREMELVGWVVFSGEWEKFCLEPSNFEESSTESTQQAEQQKPKFSFKVDPSAGKCVGGRSSVFFKTDSLVNLDNIEFLVYFGHANAKCELSKAGRKKSMIRMSIESDNDEEHGQAEDWSGFTAAKQVSFHRSRWPTFHEFGLKKMGIVPDVWYQLNCIVSASEFKWIPPEGGSLEATKTVPFVVLAKLDYTFGNNNSEDQSSHVYFNMPNSTVEFGIIKNTTHNRI